MAPQITLNPAKFLGGEHSFGVRDTQAVSLLPIPCQTSGTPPRVCCK